MRSSRQTQPYRRGNARAPGAALTAMLKGRTTTGYNPADAQRAAALIAAAKRHKRPTRPQRPKRPAR
jgi:hypothetical protein